ncbi:MAG: hypothetical protein JNL83_29585 [Myxococcales bacterium]|nr:hypothetical protein [Myxococcales bacterium]
MRTFLVSFLTAAALVGCADPAQPTDELAGESDADGEAGKTDRAAEAFTYYELRVDDRRCLVADGECGVGFYAARVNRTATQCGRGPMQPECKVFAIDWRGTAMPASVAMSYEDRVRAGEHLVVRGSVVPAANDASLSLAVTEIWVGNEKEPGAGVFALVKDNGIRCVRAPCPSLTEQKLNSNLSAQLTGVELEASGASDDQLSRAYEQLYGEGLIVVGYRDYDSLGGKTRGANTFYTRAPVPLH